MVVSGFHLYFYTVKPFPLAFCPTLQRLKNRKRWQEQKLQNHTEIRLK
jgi:hypothetical protein